MFQQKRKLVFRKFIKIDKIQFQHLQAIITKLCAMKFTCAQVNASDSFI